MSSTPSGIPIHTRIFPRPTLPLVSLVDAHSSNKKLKVESRYADVPNVMFYCHMCKKHMWDAASFENHVKGRTHMMMKDGVEESYRLRANMIRQEAKIEEQLKTIELERLKRMGKGAKGNQRREYCTMCDLHFFGNLSSHRKTDGHLQLKKFLHPRCGECAQEFSNRIDYDTHLLMPEHMKKAFVTKANKPERRKNALVIYTADDELKDLKEEKEVRKKAAAAKKEAAAAAAAAADASGDGSAAAAAAAGDEPMEEDGGDDEDGTKAESTMDDGDADGDADGGDGAADKSTDGAGAADDEAGDANATDDADKSTAGPDASVAEAEDVILDFSDGDEVPVEVEGKIPKYNCHRQIGFSMLHKLDCFECHLCGRFFDTERTAEIHSRTITHHRNFVKFLNEKSNDTKIAEKRAAAALEESERKKRKLDAAAANANPSSSSSATATKTSSSESAAQNGAEAKAVVVKTDPVVAGGEEKRTDGGDESYDPSEATADDEADETMEAQDDDGDAQPTKDEPAEESMEVKTESADTGAADATVDDATSDEVPVAPEPPVISEAAAAEKVVEVPVVEEPAAKAAEPTTPVAAAPIVPAAAAVPTPTPTPTKVTPTRARGRGRGGRKY